jgi:toxin FitB
MWLLDTNVISELRKPRPDKNVINWVETQSFDMLLTSAVCIAEIRAGIQQQSNADERTRLQNWYANSVEPMFQRQTIQVSENILLIWLRLIKQLHAKRVTVPSVDLLVAATSMELNVPVATRDVKPFVNVGVSVLNPWTGERYNGA